MSEETLIRVEAPHFTAGLILRDGKCLRAAPILGWTVGRSRDHLRAHFAKCGWKASVVKEHAPGDGMQPETKT